MVLSRKRSRLGLMHEALQALGIPSEQPEKLALNEMAPVQDVVALLDVLVSPQHNLSLARALKSPLFQWSDADLVTLAEQVQDRRVWRTTAQAPEPSWWDSLHSMAGANEGACAAVRWTRLRA